MTVFTTVQLPIGKFSVLLVFIVVPVSASPILCHRILPRTGEAKTETAMETIGRAYRFSVYSEKHISHKSQSKKPSLVHVAEQTVYSTFALSGFLLLYSRAEVSTPTACDPWRSARGAA